MEKLEELYPVKAGERLRRLALDMFLGEKPKMKQPWATPSALLQRMEPEATLALPQTAVMKAILSLLVAVGLVLVALPSPCMGQTVDGLHLELRNFGKDGRTVAGWSAWAQRMRFSPNATSTRCIFGRLPTRWPYRGMATLSNTAVGRMRLRALGPANTTD